MHFMMFAQPPFVRTPQEREETPPPLKPLPLFLTSKRLRARGPLFWLGEQAAATLDAGASFLQASRVPSNGPMAGEAEVVFEVDARGGVLASGGVRVAAGGLQVVAGGVAVNSGGLTVHGGLVLQSGSLELASNEGLHVSQVRV